MNMPIVRNRLRGRAAGVRRIVYDSRDSVLFRNNQLPFPGTDGSFALALSGEVCW